MKRRASIKLIEQAVSEGWVRQLAAFYLLKFTYINSCIYNFRSRRDEIAQQLGVSTKTWYSYLQILRSRGLVFNHNRNLCLKSIRDFGSRTKCTLLIDGRHSLRDVTDMLYGKVIERKARQQAFTESISRFRKSINGFRRGDKSISKHCESPFCPSMSSRTLANLLNVSEFKARMTVKNLQRLGFLWVHKQKPRLVSRAFLPLEFLDDLPGRRFYIGGSLYEQFGSRLEFLMYPVVLKRMTVRKFMKYIRSQRLVKVNAPFISMNKYL